MKRSHRGTQSGLAGGVLPIRAWNVALDEAFMPKPTNLIRDRIWLAACAISLGVYVTMSHAVDAFVVEVARLWNKF